MGKKQQIMELWKQNFQDPEDFIQFYFKKKYSNENALVYEENHKAVSSFLLLPYPMSWLKTVILTSYISGACTRQEARNQGYMTLLLKEALTKMNKAGVVLSTLIPAEDWLFKYYNKLGYASVFDYSTEIYVPDSIPHDSSFQVTSPTTFHPEFTTATYRFFSQAMEHRICCIQHSYEDYMAIIEEAYLCGGRLLTISRNQEIKGWGLAIPQANHTFIKEILWENEPCKKALLQQVFNIWPNKPIICKLPPYGPHYHSYGMARIINAQQMLKQVSKQNPGLTLTIKIDDPQLSFNTGIYKLSQGECQKIKPTGTTTDAETDIPTLTQALLGYHPEQLPFPLKHLAPAQQPYMNLMLD